jgi:hypothetical protein
MSLRPIALLLWLSIPFVGGLTREAVAENLAANCQALPHSLPRPEGRWMYRTNRTTDQKCWFPVGVRDNQRIKKVAVVAERSGLTTLEETTVQTCVPAPTALAPRDTQWRYSIDRRTHQRCWHLSSVVTKPAPAARTRTRPPGGPKQSQQDSLYALRSVSEVHASLLVANSPGAGNAANNGGGDPADDAPSQAPTITFESRWTVPREFSRPIDATLHQEKTLVLIPEDREHTVAEVAQSPTKRLSVVDSLRLSGLVIAIVASITIATGLYATINGSAASIRWIRGQPSVLHPRKNTRDLRLPRDSTIADILERLNGDDNLSLLKPRRPATSKAEVDRSAILAKEPIP